MKLKLPGADATPPVRAETPTASKVVIGAEMGSVVMVGVALPTTTLIKS